MKLTETKTVEGKDMNMAKSTSRISLFFCIILLLTVILAVSSRAGFGKKEILILTSSEDYKMDFLEEMLEKEFPELDIVFEYKSSGDHAAYLKASGRYSEYQITHNLEYGYLDELQKLGYLADLEGTIDFDVFADDVLESTFYVPEERNGGSIIVNLDVLEERGLEKPESYEDLLDEKYKDLISMPSPISSGTGYMFLLSLVNEWGEDKAFEYFDALSENVLSFTSSGSGPVNALVIEEAAIGLGMTGNAVTRINEGANLEILYFDEGSPYSLYGQGIVAGYEEDEDVVAVFKYLAGEATEEKCANFFPERIYSEKTFEVKNYPSDIKYSDMSDNTPERKAELLKKWKH